jgi:choline kinase
MDALILAAGFGSRLVSHGVPKPLVEVHRIPLIEWAVRQVARAGVTRAVVVTGYRADEIEAVLPGIAARSGVALEPCRLDDWTRPNGHSVMAGAARIEGNYLLVMSDHLFGTGLIETLAGAFDGARGAVLAIDRDCTGETIDPADATFVQTFADGRIAAIGKQLTAYNAVDCGAFVATPDLAAAIAASVAAGAPGSLSDGMQHLAGRGLATTLDMTGHWWIDVDDPRMHALAERLAPTTFIEEAAQLRHTAA